MQVFSLLIMHILKNKDNYTFRHPQVVCYKHGIKTKRVKTDIIRLVYSKYSANGGLATNTGTTSMKISMLRRTLIDQKRK